MARNTFVFEVLPDGRIKVTNDGGFDPTVHKDADDLLAWLQSVMGAEPEVKSHRKSLNPTQHQHQHGKLKH